MDIPDVLTIPCKGGQVVLVHQDGSLTISAGVGTSVYTFSAEQACSLFDHYRYFMAEIAWREVRARKDADA